MPYDARMTTERKELMYPCMYLCVYSINQNYYYLRGGGEVLDSSRKVRDDWDEWEQANSVYFPVVRVWHGKW